MENKPIFKQQPVMHDVSKYFTIKRISNLSLNREVIKNNKMAFKNHYNASPAEGETDFQPSQTIPDQTMSVAEIMRRHAQGLPMEGVRVPQYYGDQIELPDFSRMDLADLEQYRIEAQQEMQALQRQIKDKEVEEAQKEAERLKSKEKPQQKEFIQEAEIVEEEKPNKEQKKQNNSPR